MSFPIQPEDVKTILDKKRRLLGRGLSYAEKILFMHEGEETRDRILVRGRDPIRLFPDRVAMQDATGTSRRGALGERTCPATKFICL